MQYRRWRSGSSLRLLVAAVLGTAVLASCATPIVGPSAAGLNQDAARDGSVTSTLQPPLHELWRRNFPAGMDSYPLIADGAAYVVQRAPDYAKSGGVYALSATTGQTLWGPFWFPGPRRSEPIQLTYEAGRLFALNTNGELTALDGKTGRQLWTMRIPGSFDGAGAPAAIGGVVYAASAGSGTTLFAVDEITGRLQWVYPMQSGVSAPAVSAGVVVRSVDCHFAGLTVRGVQLWRIDLPCSGGGGSTPVLHDGRLYLPGETGTEVLDPMTGRQLAYYPAAEHPGGEPPPVFDGTLAIIGHFGATVDNPYGVYSTLRAVDTTTGAVRWRYRGPTSATMLSAGYPVVTNHLVYWPTDQGQVVVLSTVDGHKVSSIRTPFDVYDVRLAVGDDRLLIQQNTVLVCYGNAA
jgi:outer membrane protein assembly factor BamB